ncbi:CD59 glycoprotein-like [Lethenteron reissneri]|uniref:CD59 glycoprotein-like n=1 Tax=Lethenteron reissneri TaxID=7753 RepID=UPI002AB63BDD|nr:CD59 glycoprotein-like [Lethenteron reissneri]XP_061403252.1 CD59 glycoprotein-like [Lethenteron reissneri]
MTCYLLGLLLVAMMFVSGGQSLKCFECSPTINKTACNERGPITCFDASLDTCGTILLYKGSSYVLLKQCLPKTFCDTVKVFDGTYSGVTLTTTCCQSDGCNVNAAPRPLGAAHVTLALLGVASSVVVSRALV